VSGWRQLLVGVAVTVLPVVSAHAQHTHDTPGAAPVAAPGATAGSSAADAFVRRARQGTERYRDQGVAIEDGYRRLGPDFPAMGEHWVNPEIVARGVIDAARPGLLTYARVNGAPTLTGVVYAVPLVDGERPPASPFEPEHWHDHLGTVDEESMLIDHEAHGASPGGMRLAVLHLWVWTENPAGRSVTDNWALPFLRLGLAAPADPPIGAARALSLLSGSLAYHVELARHAGTPGADDQRRIEEALTRCAERVTGWWTARGSVAPLTTSEVDGLEAMWRSSGQEIERAVAPDVARRLHAIWRP
jgi:AcrR family transcriptional regulator